jgi:hypothetical protein
METSQFEAVKVTMKQDKDGYVLTLRIHPDDVPDEVLRDFVGSRYMAVMVRLNEEERPMNREQELGRDMVRASGMLCREPAFWDFLEDSNQIYEKSEKEATEWMYRYLKVSSRSDIPKSQQAIEKLLGMKEEFKLWKLQRE